MNILSEAQMSVASACQRLEYLCGIIPPLLAQIPEEDFSRKPAPASWSKKEILGHLIDSATNNHQRFVRAQFENIPRIVYQQDHWNVHSYYQQMSSEQVIFFWKSYNLFLCTLLKHIPHENLLNLCDTADNESHTISWLFNDYVKHQEHHLKQIVTYG